MYIYCIILINVLLLQHRKSGKGRAESEERITNRGKFRSLSSPEISLQKSKQKSGLCEEK